MGFQFSDNKIPFAIYNCVQSLACVAFQIIESFISPERNSFEYYIGIIYVLSFFCCAATLKFDYIKLVNN